MGTPWLEPAPCRPVCGCPSSVPKGLGPAQILLHGPEHWGDPSSQGCPCSPCSFPALSCTQVPSSHFPSGGAWSPKVALTCSLCPPSSAQRPRLLLSARLNVTAPGSGRVQAPPSAPPPHARGWMPGAAWGGHPAWHCHGPVPCTLLSAPLGDLGPPPAVPRGMHWGGRRVLLPAL